MKILLITLSNLGDIVLTLPVLHALKVKFPDARLHVHSGAAGEALLKGDPRIESLRVAQKKATLAQRWKLVRSIRRERYDLIIDLKYSLLGFLGGARTRNRYRWFSRGPVDRGARHLAALEGIAEPAPGSFFEPLEASRGNAERLVVAAVGAKSDTKIWPAEHFAVLLDRLVLCDGCRVVLVGDAADRGVTGRVRSLMSQPAEDLAGSTDVKALVRLISTAALVITNDSAPLHIADALGVPSVALFGPTDPRKYAPRHPRSVAARLELFCSPCERAQCRYSRECLSELTPGQVYLKARGILEEPSLPQMNLKVLAVRLDRIGDLALSLPALAAIRGHFPNASLSVMTRPSTASLLDGQPGIDEIIAYHYEGKGRHRGVLGNARFIREVRARGFDIAFVLNPAHRAHLVTWAAGIRTRIGLDRGWSAAFLSRRVGDGRSQGTRHESDYTLDVVRAFGIQPGAANAPSLTVFPDAQLRAQALCRIAGADKSCVAVHPGASCPSKRWPVERFAETARRLVSETGSTIVIVGGPEEAAGGRALKEQLGDAAVDLTGKLSLSGLAAVLKECRLLVSNDSGPVHIAAAVGTPTLTVFGRNRAGLSPVRWQALGKGHRLIQKDVGCVVCLAHRCPIEFECLKAVSVDEVVGQAKEMLMTNDKAQMTNELQKFQ